MKVKLEKWTEAENLYDRAIAAFGDKPPAATLANAALVKEQLKKLEGAKTGAKTVEKKQLGE